MVSRTAWKRLRLSQLDPAVLGLTLLLLIFGLTVMASADLAGLALLPQLRWLGLAALSTPFLVWVPYRRFLKWSPLLWGLGVALLLAVLLVGTAINGSRRWLPLLGFGFQPSEFAKLATALFLAHLTKTESAYARWRDLLVPAAAALIPAVLILKEPDLGNSLLFLPMLAVAWIAGGIPWRRLGTLLLSGMILLAALYQFGLEEYQRERIWSTYRLEAMTPAQRAGPGYQLDQSLLAIGNGGFWGHGLGDGPVTQSGRLPYQHNDFVFAVLAEEQGWLGTTLIVALQLALILAMLRLARVLRDHVGRVLILLIGTLIGTQTLVHLGVTLGVLPTKGLPLPLFSAGGTALFAVLSGLTLVQNVAVHRARFPMPGRRWRDDF